MAKIYRWTVIGTAGGSPAAQFVTSWHYQTDVEILAEEPSPDTILDDILTHFSGSGHNLSFMTSIMDNSSKLTASRLYERVAPGSDDLPLVAEEALDLPGLLSSPTDRNPTPLCVWLRANTGIASRAARGGTHTPPIAKSTALTSTGTWDTADSIWSAIGDLAAKLDDGFAVTGGAEVNPKVYSRTRRARDEEPFTFTIESVTPSTVPRWLRRRQTAP